MHNPDLFNHTKTGKIQSLRRTQDGTKDGFGGSLSKAGATAMGIENAAPDATLSQTGMSRTQGNGTTQHWKSTYKNSVETSLAQPAQKSQPPEWSLPRQAYTSKRSYFYTESMKSFGTYGNNPLQKLKSEDAGKTDLHELK